MHQFRPFVLLLMLLLSFNLCRALEYFKLTTDTGISVAYTIVVDKFGRGNFTSIQDAINTIPSRNDKWIRIQISYGRYQEKIIIPADKPYIFLDGRASRGTIIEWGDHETTSSSCTFVCESDNFIANGITFRNTYNVPPTPRLDSNPIKQAVAAGLKGDKHAFYRCGFSGLQDTLWDGEGRHYFYGCSVEGGIDFIWGSGQSIYEGCIIHVNLNSIAPEKSQGYITAQGRNSSNDTGGFVFKNCYFNGNGKVYLGRAYGAYSRVIIANSILSDIVVPEGWDGWYYKNNTENVVYAESGCSGPGADTSKRVNWEKKLSPAELHQFLDLSYINQDGWIPNETNLV